MAKFEMDTEFIAKLAKLLEETHLGEIEMADGDRRIRVARQTVHRGGAGPDHGTAERARGRAPCRLRHWRPITAPIPAR